MAQQGRDGDGWPLGLQPLNVRIVGLPVNRDYSESLSFNTLITGSPISVLTDSSSDLDTQSTGSFFHDKSITLGSLIGVSRFLEFPRRSIRGRRNNTESVNDKIRSNNINRSSKTRFFSLCSKDRTDAEIVNNGPSLGHFLETERRRGGVADEFRRNQSLMIYAPNELELAQSQPALESNSLFVNGCVAPPSQSNVIGSESDVMKNGGTELANDSRIAMFFACCGN